MNSEIIKQLTQVLAALQATLTLLFSQIAPGSVPQDLHFGTISNPTVVTTSTLATSGGAVASTTFTAGNALVGGGDLSANRFFSLQSSTANGNLLIGSGVAGSWNITTPTASGTNAQVNTASGTLSFGIASNPDFTALTVNGAKVSTSSAAGTVTTSSALTAGQWIVASAASTIYSTSSQPLITLNASGTNITVSGPSATGTSIVGFLSAPTFLNITDSGLTVNQWLTAGASGLIVSTSSQPAITGSSPLTISATGTISTGFSSSTFANATATVLTDAVGNKYVTSTAVASIGACYGNEVSNVIDQVPLSDFFATSTIRDVYAENIGSGVGVTASGSVVFNLGFTTSTSNASSSWSKLFTSDKTVASLGTSTLLSVNGSTTWPTSANPGGFPWKLGYYTGPNSSSSEFCYTVHFTTP